MVEQCKSSQGYRTRQSQTTVEPDGEDYIQVRGELVLPSLPPELSQFVDGGLVPYVVGTVPDVGGDFLHLL